MPVCGAPAAEAGVCTECEVTAETVRLWGVGSGEKAGEGGALGLREVVEAPGRCWRVQPQGSWQLRVTRGCCGGHTCGLGLGVGAGWSVRGGMPCLGGQEKAGCCPVGRGPAARGEALGEGRVF